MSSRPELTPGGASLFYNSKEARKYDSSSRMIGIQREITERAIELLKLNDEGTPKLVLDVGCGSGLSGQVLQENGHYFIGCDISRDMLLVAQERQQQDESEETTTAVAGDLLHHDMGTGLPFRPATFDACISISALQWLCYCSSNDQNPRKRLVRFFSSLYSVLKRGGRAVLQFYPETAEQAVLISESATRVGFSGGVVVDYPNSAKAKKHYLVLSFDKQSKQIPTASGVNPNQVTVIDNSRKKKAPPRKKKGGIKTKEWILHKKETQRKKGKNVRPDTKYTARRRPNKF